MTKITGNAEWNRAGEPPIYDPILDFDATNMVGRRVFVWSREAEDIYQGAIEQYNAGDWPRYVVLIDANYQAMFDAPARITFNEGAFTDSGSYRIVGATTDKGEPGAIPVEDAGWVVNQSGMPGGPVAGPFKTIASASNARRQLEKEHPDRNYLVQVNTRPEIMSDTEVAAAADKLIQLPGEMYAALITRRPELVAMLRANIMLGRKLSPDEVEGILILAEQTIEAEAGLVATLAEHRKALKDMVANAAGVVNMLNRMVEQLDTHPSNVGGQGGRH